MKGRRKTPPSRRREVGQETKPTAEAEPSHTQKASFDWTSLLIGLMLLSAGIWSYWPTIAEMVHAWEAEPDYSHGYLVPPMALLFLWFRKATFPGFARGAWLLGAGLLALSFVIRLCAGKYFLEAIDGWSLLLWIAGSVAILFGLPVLKWSWTSIAFLFFMIPLPFRIEGLMSLPLQRIATRLSCWTLQILGQPAIAEGNTILMGEHTLEIEQACSGLRLFVSILALAFAYMVFTNRGWWERCILLASVVPIAIVANVARIVATGLLYQLVSSDVGKHFAHDLAGWVMIPFAAMLFALMLWYMSRLFVMQEDVEMAKLVRRVEIN